MKMPELGLGFSAGGEAPLCALLSSFTVVAEVPFGLLSEGDNFAATMLGCAVGFVFVFVGAAWEGADFVAWL